MTPTLLARLRAMVGDTASGEVHGAQASRGVQQGAQQTALSQVAEGLGGDTLDALGPRSPYLQRLYRKAQETEVLSHAPSEAGEAAGQQVDRINLARALRKLNQR